MICVSIAEKNPDRIVSIANESEMAEIRIDLCELSMEQVANVFSRINKPTIATCRPAFANNEIRSKLLKTAIENGATFVDLEIESVEDFKTDLRTFAHAHNSKVIISYHNYECTPPIHELRTIVQNCFSQQADIAKIATTALSPADSATVLSLYSEFQQLVALAMGEMGKITRIANLYLGSPFTFAAISKQQATAGGQLILTEMQAIINAL